MSVRTLVRPAVRTGAEVLVTLGACVVLLVVYLVVWSDVQAAAAQDELREDFERRAAAATALPAGAVPAPALASSPLDPAVLPGEAAGAGGQQSGGGVRADGTAVLHVPRLGAGWSRVVVEGVEPADLKRGPGHVPGTAEPGQVGNYAVAGHRATSGEPFEDLDDLRAGDHVVVQTAQGWFDYVVERSRIVEPTAVEVLAPVPFAPGATPTQASVTLITCHPRWSSAQRLVVVGRLVEQRPAAAGPPASLAGGA